MALIGFDFLRPLWVVFLRKVLRPLKKTHINSLPNAFVLHSLKDSKVNDRDALQNVVHIDTLPNEILCLILKHLDLSDREVVTRVSEKWSSLIQSVWDSQTVLVSSLSKFGKDYSYSFASGSNKIKNIEKCPNLKVLHYTHQDTKFHLNIFKIFSKCRQLEHLEVVWPGYRISYLNDLTLMPTLKNLSVTGTTCFDGNWGRVFQCLSMLEAFSKTDLLLCELDQLLQTKNLKALSSNKIIGNLYQVINLFTKKKHTLLRLQVDEMCCCDTNIDEEAARILFKQLPHLTHLKIKTRYRALPVLKLLPDLKGITWENLPNTYFPGDYKNRKAAGYYENDNTENMFDELYFDDDISLDDFYMGEQKETYLRPEENLGFNFYLFLTDHNQLTYINLIIKNVIFPFDCIRDIGVQCPKLKTFILRHSRLFKRNEILNNDIFLYLSKAAYLKTLILLTFPILSKDVFEHLQEFKSLTTLIVNESPRLEISSLKRLVECGTKQPKLIILMDIGFQKYVGRTPILGNFYKIKHNLDYNWFARKILM